MSRQWMWAVGTAAAIAIGCGGTPPEPKDPTSEVKPDETPKWEGSDTTPSTTPTAVKIADPSARRGDVYDKEATEIVLKRAARQVKENCGHAKDDTGKAVGPWGKANVKVMLGHNGHSKGTTVPAPFEGKAPGNCIVKAFTNLTFPPWAGADTEVDWEVEVVAPEGAGAPPKK